MLSPRYGCASVVGLVAALIATATPASAQLIQLKTVPVAAGDQFLVFPSRNLAMGGVFIAVDDPLLDPFVNPAKGARLEGSRLFGSPTFYNISDENGAGRTLPVGVLLGSDRWFGGVSLSLQQLEAAERNRIIWVRPLWFDGAPAPLSEKSANNVYASALLGRKLDGGRTSIAAGIFWAGLDAVDGVELLYALSQSIEQSGHIVDYRVGLLHEFGANRSVEVLLLRNRFDMTHDVTYLDWVRDDSLRMPRLQTRVEQNLDETDTWGLHLRYVQPLGEAGWRIGGILTGNWKSHPKIPNYEIMNIPRDPGDSWAYNVGLGLSRVEGLFTVGIDLVFEPIWTETWAEADSAVKTRSGKVLAKGEKTVENDFWFSNAHIRMGIGREQERYAFQLGLAVHSFRYELEQFDRVEETKRDQEESWMEWTPSWGLALKFPELEVRYLGRLTTGTGRPGVEWTGTRRAFAEAARAADFIIAPSGPLTLQDARVLTHQVSVSIPIR
ncbi:MAG: hypothetical protein HY704_00325 [Gemmatimonadetes bacterium]|nr:hypothetical protein [Gemmatimonadota bacterium]